MGKSQTGDGSARSSRFILRDGPLPMDSAFAQMVLALLAVQPPCAQLKYMVDKDAVCGFRFTWQPPVGTGYFARMCQCMCRGDRPTDDGLTLLFSDVMLASLASTVAREFDARPARERPQRLALATEIADVVSRHPEQVLQCGIATVVLAVFGQELARTSWQTCLPLSRFSKRRRALRRLYKRVKRALRRSNRRQYKLVKRVAREMWSAPTLEELLVQHSFTAHRRPARDVRLVVQNNALYNPFPLA